MVCNRAVSSVSLLENGLLQLSPPQNTHHVRATPGGDQLPEDEGNETATQRWYETILLLLISITNIDC